MNNPEIRGHNQDLVGPQARLRAAESGYRKTLGAPVNGMKALGRVLGLSSVEETPPQQTEEHSPKTGLQHEEGGIN